MTVTVPRARSAVRAAPADPFERRATREALRQMTLRLVAEHPHVPADVVVACVARCREELLRADVREGLVTATETAARTRLRAMATAHAT